ncbi:acyltransferase [Sphingobium amiense]|uniref:Acyltransferase n=1 Tax=Sphingobium amiense TaxID=135719 RepID=A0A494WFM2_9SPHN|nr:acyltransferase [Sphingobium amiense]BBD99732.1 acyltransferase [Sphingobium amiense]
MLGWMRRLGLKAESDELMALDFLRIVASVGVVVYHYRHYVWLPADSAFNAMSASFARQWVDLFFVISGFVVSYVYAGRIRDGASFGRYMRKRLARLLPLHWLTLGLYALLGLAIAAGVQSNSADHYDWGCFVPNLLLLHSFNTCDKVSFNTPSWSISAEMAMYLLFPLLLMLAARTRGWGVLALSAIAILLLTHFSSGDYGGDEGFWLSWASHFGVLRAIPSFALGVGLHAFRHRITGLPMAEGIMFAALAAFIATGLAGIHPLWSLLFVYATVIAAIAVDLNKKASLPVRKLGIAGQLTYSLYMLHPIVATLSMTAGKKILHLRGWEMNIWVVVTFLILIPVSLLSYHLFEKPLRARLSGGPRPPRTAHQTPAATL